MLKLIITILLIVGAFFLGWFLGDETSQFGSLLDLCIDAGGGYDAVQEKWVCVLDNIPDLR